MRSIKVNNIRMEDYFKLQDAGIKVNFVQPARCVLTYSTGTKIKAALTPSKDLAMNLLKILIKEI